MFCPSFIFEMASARAAAEFLGEEFGLEAFSGKYAEGLGSRYSEVDQDSLHQAAEGMIQFLSEIEAGENAVELLHSFVYFRLYFEGPGRPRKMKPMFGSIEDPVKQKEHSIEAATKAFRAFVLGCAQTLFPTPPLVGSLKMKRVCQLWLSWPLKAE